MFRFPNWRDASTAPIPFYPPELPKGLHEKWAALYYKRLDFYPPAESWFNTVEYFLCGMAHDYPDPRPDDFERDKTLRELDAWVKRRRLERVIDSKRVLGDYY